MELWTRLTSLDFREWIGPLLTGLVTVFILSMLAHLAISRLERFLIQRKIWPESLSLVAKFFVSVQLFILSSALIVIAPTLKAPQPVEDFLLKAGKVGTIVAVALFLMNMTSVITKAYMRSLRIDRPDNLRERSMQTRLVFIEKLSDILIFVIGAAIVLMNFEGFRQFGSSLLASAGVASIILGIAAQRSLGNLIAGFQIAFTQPIRLGDAVIVEGEFGNIEEITLTYVVVRLWDLRRLILPINYFLEKPFQNWTRTSADLIGQVIFYLDYTFPIEALREEFLRQIQLAPLWDKKTAVLQVVDTSDKTVTVRVLVSAAGAGQAWDLRCWVREKLLTFIQQTYPQSLPRSRYDVDGTAIAPPPVRSMPL